MSSRLVLLVLATLTAATAVSCSGCRWPWRAQPEVVKVRWPATSPVDHGPHDRTEDVSDDQLMVATQVAPGVRVREGRVLGLTYFEVILGDADFDDPLPFVMLLHGRGDRPRIPGGPFNGVPTPMRLIIPRGPIRLGAGYAWVLGSVTQDTPALLASTLLKRTHHLAALIDTLSKTLPTLGRPIVAGFSQGAMLTFSLALHRPDVVGRAFPLVGWVPPELMPQRLADPGLRVPIRAVHGVADPVLRIALTRDVVARLRALDWDVELVEFEGVGHVVSPEMNATFEAWLEEALREQAPALTGRGLGMVGPEDEKYDPFEPLERETIKAIEKLEETGTVPSETEGDAPPADSHDEPVEGGRDEGAGGDVKPR